MDLESVLQTALVASVVFAGATLAGAALERAPRKLLVAAAALVGAAAGAAWVAYALSPDVDVAAAAAGITGCLLATLGALALRRGIAYGRRVEEEVTRAEERLRALIDAEAEARAAELERTLARARADSASLLAQEERRIADERRAEIVEREHAAANELAGTLATVQQRVEKRLAGWADDLDRAQQGLVTQLERLAQRQTQLIAEAESRMEEDSKQLTSAPDEQRSAVGRLREDLVRVAQEAVASARAELDTHAAERRRALHEVSERLRRRERELRDQIEREETEAVRRIQSAFADVERRQVEQLQRVVEREAGRYVEAAEQQFAVAMKGAREDAAQRLSRELDRAVATFVREAQSVIAERMGQAGDLGEQRIEKRFSQIAAGLERQREEVFAEFERRFAEAESNLLRRLQALERDAALAERPR